MGTEVEWHRGKSQTHLIMVMEATADRLGGDTLGVSVLGRCSRELRIGERVLLRVCRGPFGCRRCRVAANEGPC